MKRETGVIIVTDPDLPHEVEIPTFTCPHCGSVGRVTSHLPRLGALLGPMADPARPQPNDDGGWCFKCARLICRKPGCADHDPARHPRFAALGFGW